MRVVMPGGIRRRQCILGVALFAVAAGAFAALIPRNGMVPREASLSLFPGPADLPWDAVLEACIRSDMLENAEAPNPEMQAWVGPPVSVSVNGARGQISRFRIMVQVDVALNPEIAARLAARESRRYASVFADVGSNARIRRFADRAWASLDSGTPQRTVATLARQDRTMRNGRIIFNRANVCASVSISRMDASFPASALVDLAERIGRRIDAAAAGRPLPAPVLPLSITEMHTDFAGAWQAHRIGETLGKPDESIILRSGSLEPRLLSAARMGTRDYMVPLAGLVASMPPPRTMVRVKGRRATAAIAGRKVELTRGSSYARVGTRTVRLRRPAVFRGTQVFVPLSLLEAIRGRKLAWSMQRGKPVARVS